MKRGEDKRVSVFKFDMSEDTQAALRVRNEYSSFRKRDLAKLVSEFIEEEDWRVYNSALGGMNAMQVFEKEIFEVSEAGSSSEYVQQGHYRSEQRSGRDRLRTSINILLNDTYEVIWQALFPHNLEGALRGERYTKSDIFRATRVIKKISDDRATHDEVSNEAFDPIDDGLADKMFSSNWLISPPVIDAPVSPDDTGAWFVELRQRPGLSEVERPDFEITVDGVVPPDAEIDWLQPEGGPDYAIYYAPGPAPVSVELTEREDGTVVIDFHTS